MFTQKRKYSLFCFVYSDILRDIYSDIFFIRSSEKDKFKTNLSGFVLRRLLPLFFNVFSYFLLGFCLDAGYEPDEEDQKHLDDVQGKQK